MLSAGTRIGPYQIVGAIGAGGMGEVYRARDSRLGRDVAVKVLPAALAGDPERLRRFEQEARATGALNHPNVLVVFDVGSHDGSPYMVAELLEGETLRERLRGGPLPPRRAVELAGQIASGLAAAHEKGIVHRDLKPENVFVTRDARVKILDFGLAKLAAPPAAATDQTVTPSQASHTEAGMVLGTAGYMSPEQVRGQTADQRSDIFAFGVILHELLSGRKVFARDTAAETMAAILREDPPELAAVGAPVTPALARIVDRCLRKDPAERWQSARDLAFALDSGPSDSEVARSSGAPRAPGRWRIVAAALGAALLACLGTLAASRRAPAAHPVFRPLTRQRGTLGAARFVPGTSDVAYSARWGSDGPQLYVTRLDQPAPRSLPGFDGLLQSVSSTGEVMGLADPYLYAGLQHGRLISLPLSGGAGRVVAEGVTSADQGEGGDAALAIFERGVHRLEWPYGHAIVKTFNSLWSLRIHGDRLAFFQDQGNTIEDGTIFIAGRTGAPRPLVPVKGFTGMAWGPDGKALWVSTFDDGESRIMAVDPGGRTRTLLTHAGRLELEDVDRQGRVLAVVHSHQRQVFGRARGKEHDQDLTWLDAQNAEGISRDGRYVLLAHMRDWTRSEGHVYLRPLDGGPAQDLGAGVGEPSMSGDARWVATYVDAPVFGLRVLPTGPGVPRQVSLPDFAGSDIGVDFLPDDRHIIATARQKGGPYSIFRIDLETGTYAKVAPDGASTFHSQTLLSPDGGWLAFEDAGAAITASGERAMTVGRVDGTDAKPVHGLLRSEAISGWYRDAGALVVFDRNVLPAPVTVLDVATGRRTPLMAITPPDPVGIAGVQGLYLAPDGGAYAYNVVRRLSELYLIEGLR